MSAARRLKLTPETDLFLAPTINNFSQGGLFSIIFGFHHSASTMAILFGTAAHYFIFPLAAITEIVAAGISAINLYSAHNKNYSRVLQLGWDILKAIGVSTVVVGSIVALNIFAAITPIVFTAILTIATLKDIGLLVWNFALWQAHKHGGDQQLADIHKQNTKRYAIGSVVGTLVTAGIITLMLSPVAPVAAAVMSITTTVAVSLSTIYGVIQGVPFLKKRWNEMTDFVSSLFTRQAEQQQDVDNVNQARVVLAGDEKENAKTVLLSAIKLKKDTLKREIDAANLSTSARAMLIERPQEAKRKAKIEVLRKYKQLIKTDATLTDLDAMFDQANDTDENHNRDFRRNLSRHAHQSFWSSDHNGGVEEISRNVESYLMKTLPV